MPIRKLTLGLGLLLAGAATVGANSYKIKDGDTVSEIAARFHVKTRDLLRANGLTASSNLKIGRVLYIPKGSSTSSDRRSASVAPGKGKYVVRNGDHDWSIAKRYGTTASAIRALNPGLEWRRLQIGQAINVPGSGARTVASRSTSSGSTKVGSTTSYRVKSGENDWIIARRVGTTPSTIRRLNPSVKWSRLQIGTVLRVPGSGSSSVASASSSTSRIRSRYAVVSRDNATIRRKPSLSGSKITTVPSGTRVTVLDRDGDWYRLRFPRGTEGWMRGDLLHAASAPRRTVAAKTTRRRTTTAVAKRRTPTRTATRTTRPTTYVASGSTQNRILSNAQAMRGVRYRYGAASRSATDCSGFTSQIFARSGYRLPRTSAGQSSTGQRVSRSSLQPGDLVFFRTRRGTRVSHVGIYMGKGKFIHASSGGGKVQVNSLSDSYYNNRYVTARRVVRSK